MIRQHASFLSGLLLAIMPISAPADETPFKLALRSQTDGKPAEAPVTWSPKKTAIIVCDMWDDHWCKSAARRVGEMAGPMNDMLKEARSRGAFIIQRRVPRPASTRARRNG